MNIVDNKICTKCGSSFPNTTEYFYSYKKNKLRSYCKKCANKESVIRVREWTKKNPDKVYYYRIKSKYGITKEEYDELFEKQKGVCAICGKLETRKIRDTRASLSVDHNHKTGEIRGLLCDRCNRRLGFFGDDVEGMERILLYLKGELV